jgi:hypothetical protein
MKRRTKAMQRIVNICEGAHLKHEEILSKAKRLLELYRHMVWALESGAHELTQMTSVHADGQLDTTLAYFIGLVPPEEQQNFNKRWIPYLHEIKWLIETIDRTLLKMAAFPVYGTQYYAVISKCYLSELPLTENELLDVLYLERSAYFEKKKEATLLFGVLFWSHVMPRSRALREAYPHSDFQEKPAAV